MKTCKGCRGSGGARARLIGNKVVSHTCRKCNGAGTHPKPVNWRQELEKQ